MNTSTAGRLCHIGKLQRSGKKPSYVFLRQTGDHRFVWFEEENGKEQATEISAASLPEALRLAHKKWKPFAFRTVICGFRYLLPERDEHGVNALFHEMVQACQSPTGTYYDQDLGHSCMVQNASLEALDMYYRLRDSNRLHSLP